jgi:hypothetical protein
MDREEDVNKYFGNGYVTESDEEYDTEEEENYEEFKEALEERQLLREIEGCDDFDDRGESLVDLFCAHDSDGDVIMCV